MTLLERETEIEALTALLDAARDGQGRVAVIEGPAGIGKTALLDASCAAAGSAGFRVLRARGAEFERGFPYGVVRQLFEAHVRRLPAAERDRLFAGAAGLASPVISADTAPAPAPRGQDAAFAVSHGLYWFAANLADTTSLLLAVDDLQWCDPESLRFLTHLARRREGVPVLVATCVRTGEAGVDEPPLSDLLAEADQAVRLAPLTEAAVARLVATGLGRPPDPAFAGACHRATGGTPFLLFELLTALRARGVRPDADAAAVVEEVGPQAVAAKILQRLRRLGPAATEVARAVAVLGPDAQLHRAARLAQVPVDEAARAVDALIEMDIVRAGQPLAFVHPIVQGAVYGDLAPAARASAHEHAADLLAAEHAEIGAVAAHLLHTEPAARRDRVERLRAAAARAAGRGAAETAATYLRRALREGGLDPAERARLLAEFGRVEALRRPTDGVVHLREAYETTSSPLERARVARDLVQGLLYGGEVAQALATMTDALETVRGLDTDLELRLEATRTALEFLNIERLPGLLSRLPRLAELAAEPTPAGRTMAALVAGIRAWLSAPRGEVHALLDRALAGNGLVGKEGGESPAVLLAFHGLCLTDELEAAQALADEVLADARRRGSVSAFAMGVSHRAWINARKGDLRAAEADLRAAVEVVREHRVTMVEFGYLWYFIDPVVERPELDDEARVLLALDVAEELQAAAVLPLSLEVRGRLRLAHGQLAGAVADLSRCEQIPYAHGNPNGWGWRPALATAIATSDRERALRLARDHLAACRHTGLPRAIGIALRTLGVVEGGADGIALLEEAVTLLEQSPARLEHARALVELGAARRRAGQRAAAREPLRLALDLAHRGGATRLEARARDELAATGARPRRTLISGRDALTPTEERVARLAASGMSNPEIAQSMFVTRKTVENHLARIYSKLGIGTRGELPEALDAAG